MRLRRREGCSSTLDLSSSAPPHTRTLLTQRTQATHATHATHAKATGANWPYPHNTPHDAPSDLRSGLGPSTTITPRGISSAGAAKAPTSLQIPIINRRSSFFNRKAIEHHDYSIENQYRIIKHRHIGAVHAARIDRPHGNPAAA